MDEMKQKSRQKNARTAFLSNLPDLFYKYRKQLNRLQPCGEVEIWF